MVVNVVLKLAMNKKNEVKKKKKKEFDTNHFSRPCILKCVDLYISLTLEAVRRRPCAIILGQMVLEFQKTGIRAALCINLKEKKQIFFYCSPTMFHLF